MKLVQTIFTGEYHPNTDDNVIKEFTEASRIIKENFGITGIFLIRNNKLLALLEGDKINVFYFLKKIRDDRRMFAFNLIHDQETFTRLFESCSFSRKLSSISAESLRKIEASAIKSNLDVVTALHQFFHIEDAS